PAVVRCSIGVNRAAVQSIRLQERLPIEKSYSRFDARKRNFACENVVHSEPESKSGARDAGFAIHRPRELQRVHEMRRDAEQRFALAHRFADHSDVSIFEVANATMYQSR